MVKIYPITKLVKEAKQPRGGYINPKMMDIIKLGDGIDELNSNENINKGLIGTAVDYLSRFMSGLSVEDAFKISMKGSMIIGEEDKAQEMMLDIKGLDDKSIENAVKLSGFDVCYRTENANYYKPVDSIKPDGATIDNIRTMVERSLKFFEKYGPKVLDGFSLEYWYGDVVIKGDGDFITKDTLWDFKTTKEKPKSDHTLQLLVYWRMGLRSEYQELKKIKYLGIYNPRTNTVYRIDVSNINGGVISEVESRIIGYRN